MFESIGTCATCFLCQLWCHGMGEWHGMDFFFETFEFLLLCYSALPSIGPIVSCSSESFSGLGKQVEEIMPCEVCSIRRG